MASSDPKKKPKTDPANPPVAEEADFFVNEEGGEAFVDFGNVAPIHEGASGVIPLDELPDPPSGQSLTSWTEVIRRQRAAAEADASPIPVPNSSSMQVDAPSDKDLLTHLLETEAGRPSTGNSSAIPLAGPLPATASDTAEIPEGELPLIADAAEEVDDGFESFINDVAGDQSPSGGSEVHFGVMPPTAETGGVHPVPEDKSSDVWSNASKQPAPRPAPVEEDDESIPFVASLGTGNSSAMLGDMPAMGPEGNRSSILDVLLSESNLELPDDLGAPSARSRQEDINNTPFRSTRPTDPAAGGLARPNLPTEPSFDAPDEAELGALPAGLEEGTSESKYGMEGLDATQFDDSDDAVDLYGEQVPQPSLSDSGSLEISEEALEEAARKQRIFESSSVDLSSRPSMHGSDFGMESVPANALVGDNGDSVDLGMPAHGDPSDSSLIRARDLDQESDSLREEVQSKRQKRTAAKQKEAEPELRPVNESSGGRGMRGALIGTTAGLLIGAGGVFGAFSAGLLGGPSGEPKQVAAAADPAELRKAREDATIAQKDLSEYQETVNKAFADAKFENPEQGLAALPSLVSDRDKATAKVADLVKEAQALQLKSDNAAKAELAAKADLKTAQEALTVSEAKATDATKAAEEANTALAAVTKSFKDAGLDAAKPADALKDLVTKKADAEKLAKETEAKAEKAAKDYEAKIETANKQATDAAKAAEDAKKAGDAVAKAKEASDATLKALGEKLAKAKFIQANADSAAVLKGLDDAIKAGTSDATLALRDELVKAKDAVAKNKADLDAATAKQQAAEKQAVTAEALAKKTADDLKALATKSQSDLAAMKTNADKLSKEVADLTAKTTDATAKAAAAEKKAADARGELSTTREQLGGQIAKLKTENDSLNKDLAAVRELSLAIKAQANSGGPAAKPDPMAMADRFFSNGLQLYHASRFSEAEASLVKTIAIFNDDARYHYLLGLALFNQGKSKEADEAFAKGAALEAQGRPTGKSVDAILERIQGRGRQVVNSHRP